MNVRTALETARNIDKLDAELLLARVMNVGRAVLRAYPERDLNPEQKLQFKDLVQRRAGGEPIAYLLGHKEFWSLDLLVTPDVLIPRPDTELLVEMALEQLTTGKKKTVLDLGTGCGAVALAIAKERPKITVVATDCSIEALHIAKLNAKHLHITNVEFALGNWYEALSGKIDHPFDIIVSNPPYIANFDPHLERGDLRFEPNRALVSGEEGMDDLRLIIHKARDYLVQDGQLMVEHGYNQQSLVEDEFNSAGFKDITCYNDLSGIPRVTVGSF